MHKLDTAQGREAEKEQMKSLMKELIKEIDMAYEMPRGPERMRITIGNGAVINSLIMGIDAIERLEAHGHSYRCIECGKVSTAHEWNEATNERYEDNEAMLPRDFEKVKGVTAYRQMLARIMAKDYISDIDLPAFICPKCGFAPMANELVEEK